MNILKEMQYNLNGPNNGVYGRSMDNCLRNDRLNFNTLHDTYGYKRATIDYTGKILDNNGLSLSTRYESGNLYNNFGSKIGYSDQFGRLRNNLGCDLGFNIR